MLIAEAQKKAETVRGEGDAAAAKIYAANFGKDPQFFEFYRTMQAYQRTLNAKDTTIIMSPGNKFLRQLESGGQ